MQTPSHTDSLPRPLRHLHWLCRAPSLICHQAEFRPEAELPDDYRQRILALLQRPEWLQSLEQAAQQRLGLYFEQLYACLLTEVLGWELLGRNLQVREAGRTLGELDFLLRNPHNGEVEHHETAVKFYLGGGDQDPRWYGPNSRDRLDLKTGHLLGHQLRMAEQPATRVMLAERGLPEPVRSRLFMPGYLFYPAGESMPPPAGVSDHHLRGCWWRASEVSQSLLESSVVLQKPDWLGPWQQVNKPDAAETLEQAAGIAAGASPRLFAQLMQDEEGGAWREARRFFLVPDHWPYSRAEST